jgi:hypothetical protein
MQCTLRHVSLHTFGGRWQWSPVHFSCWFGQLPVPFVTAREPNWSIKPTADAAAYF